VRARVLLGLGRPDEATHEPGFTGAASRLFPATGGCTAVRG
jgi:hypothetical protein